MYAKELRDVMAKAYKEVASEYFGISISDTETWNMDKNTNSPRIDMYNEGAGNGFGSTLSTFPPIPEQIPNLYDPSRLTKKELIQSHIDMQIIIDDLMKNIDMLNASLAMKQDYINSLDLTIEIQNDIHSRTIREMIKEIKY
jgi:hypothetical protein